VIVVALMLAAAVAAQTRDVPRQTPEAVAQQTRALSAPDPIDRAFAACFLAGMGRRAAPAVPALAALLGDTAEIDPVVCRGGVGTVGPTSIVTLEKSSPGIEAARALGAIGEAAVDRLLEGFASPDADVRYHAARGLALVRDARATDALTAGVGDADARVRSEVALGLGRRRDPRVPGALVTLAGDREPDVRRHAVRAIGRFGSFDGSVGLLTDALDDADARVRREAAGALGRRRGESSDGRATSALLSALEDDEPTVRERAVVALGSLRDTTAVPDLLPLLRDRDPEIREQAATALGRLRDPRSVGPLIDALRDRDAGVRQRAAWALGRMPQGR
jgi:HEAT repeat protein